MITFKNMIDLSVAIIWMNDYRTRELYNIDTGELIGRFCFMKKMYEEYKDYYDWEVLDVIKDNDSSVFGKVKIYLKER